MSWFKVDDKFHDHPKARKAGKAAVGVWVLAGTWCADNLTDGFVPAHVLTRWGTRTDAKRLVDAGLWETAVFEGERGWRFLKWEKYQPTRASKKAQREARAAAGRVGGLASGEARRKQPGSTVGEATAKQSASHIVEPPSRPVPSRPDQSVVTQADQSQAVTPEHGLTDRELEAIQTHLRCDRDHAARVADLVLTTAAGHVTHRLRYVLRAIENAPVDRFEPKVRNPRAGVDELCQVPGHSDFATRCRQCASEAKAVGK